jgi:hypothetical protein
MKSLEKQQTILTIIKNLEMEALVLYTNTLVCTPHREKRRERKKKQG